MNIAICDDEKYILEEIKDRILKYFNKKNISCRVDVFEEFNEFFIKNNSYDLAFLDYNMPGENGIEFAKRLRLENQSIFLIFLTSVPEHVFESFSLNTFRYLLKPLGDETLEEALDAFERIYQKNKKIFFQKGNQSFTIDADEVMYIEANGRRTIVHTTRCEHEIYKSISAFQAEINNPHFFRTYRSYIVNMKYISSYDKKNIYLTNGTVVFLSPKLYNEFVKTYNSYLRFKI